MAIEDENNYGLSGVQVKELVAQVKKRAVSVGEDGSSHVEEADQIYTKTLQLQEAAFVYRTTAGDLSIETGEANLLKLYGKTVQEGHVDEVKDLSYELADTEATVSIDWAVYANPTGVFSGTDFVGKTISVQIRAVGSGFRANFVDTSDESSIIDTSTTNISGAGITVTGNFSDGDVLSIHYVPLTVGTLTTAKPTSFVSTGYNQYNATAGYAHVVGGQEYRIDGTYTSLGFTEEIGGTTTAVTVTNNKFTPEADGYIYVTGGSGDILIALVWSGTRDSDPYVAYSADTISIPTIDIDSTSLPTASYGMPSVGNVADELDFEERLYIQRIGHYAYSAENLETVEALGVDYWYDEEDIFYVLETPITYHLATSVKSAYTANDFGTEEIVGTSVAMPVMISYGNNLVDKLRNLLPIQAIGDKLEMDGTTLNVAQSALGDILTSTPGKSTTKGMYQKSIIDLLFSYYPDNGDIRNNRPAIRIGTVEQVSSQGVGLGWKATVSGPYSVGVGAAAKATQHGTLALGQEAEATAKGAVACGYMSKATVEGQFDISGGVNAYTKYGYNGTGYRLLTGLYDGQSNHDAATVAQGNKLMTVAPTTTDAGVLGQLWTDTVNMHTYQLTAIDDTDPSNPVYTWTQRW